MRLCFSVMLPFKRPVSGGTVASRWLEVRRQGILDKVRRHSGYVFYVVFVRGGEASREKKTVFCKVGELQISDPIVSLTSGGGRRESLAAGMTGTNLRGEI
jgi:hypothetical protein